MSVQSKQKYRFFNFHFYLFPFFFLQYGLCVSRASAACINLNSGATLLPMCKFISTSCRKILTVSFFVCAATTGLGFLWPKIWIRVRSRSLTECRFRLKEEKSASSTAWPRLFDCHANMPRNIFQYNRHRASESKCWWMKMLMLLSIKKFTLAEIRWN